MDLLKQLRELIKPTPEETHKAILGQLNTFVEIDNPLKFRRGVYQLENFYIGKSGGFRSRFAYHLMEAIGVIKDVNYKKNQKIRETLCKRKLEIKILCNDPEKEEAYIVKYSTILPLTNIEFIHTHPNKKIQPKKKKVKTKKKPIVKKVFKPKVKKEIEQKESEVKHSMEKASKFTYVAVRMGRKPGLYKQEDDWKEQIFSFSGRLFKGFDDLDEAWEYLANNQVNIENAKNLTEYENRTISRGKKKKSNSVNPLDTFLKDIAKKKK